ncbi:TPA: hypothetical protein ACXJLS_000360 [Stenotrophomonas maltophilia]
MDLAEKRARQLIARQWKERGSEIFADGVLDPSYLDPNNPFLLAVVDSIRALDDLCHRDSRELRRLCSERDAARNERDAAKSEMRRMEACLQRIAGYRLNMFSGPNDMAIKCISEAESALAKKTDTAA